MLIVRSFSVFLIGLLGSASEGKDSRHSLILFLHSRCCFDDPEAFFFFFFQIAQDGRDDILSEDNLK